MAHTQSMERLMKWASREDWRDEMDFVFEQHLGTACAEMDLDLEDLPEYLGEHHFMNLCGCALEDLVAREAGDGRNLADEYLKRRGWKESASAKAYIRALRRSVMSLYEVSGIRRDEGFFARDLLRGGEPLWINEKIGTHDLAEWDRIGARVLTVSERTQLAGGLLFFEHDVGEALIAGIRGMVGTKAEDVAKQIAELARDAGEEEDEATQELIDMLARWVTSN